MKAADITDEQIYQAIDKIRAEKQQYVAYLWDMREQFPTVPPKILQAKLKTMVNKRRLEGCACGCRGDFTRPV